MTGLPPEQARRKRAPTMGDEWEERLRAEGMGKEPRPDRARGSPLKHDHVRADDIAERPPARVSIKDVPGFDSELGRVLEEHEPAVAPTQARIDRWVRLATDIVGRLGQLSRYRGHMPVARLPPLPRGFTVDAPTLRSLPDLERLHRALFPGWRVRLRDWFAAVALARAESKVRDLPSMKGEPHYARLAKNAKTRRIGRPILGARYVPSAVEILEMLRRQPEDAADPVPQQLTAEMLDYLAEHVKRGRGGAGGGWTPETATELAEQLAANPKAFKEKLSEKLLQKTRRKKRRKSAETRD